MMASIRESNMSERFWFLARATRDQTPGKKIRVRPGALTVRERADRNPRGLK
jgi:hypothetical protein